MAVERFVHIRSLPETMDEKWRRKQTSTGKAPPGGGGVGGDAAEQVSHPCRSEALLPRLVFWSSSPAALLKLLRRCRLASSCLYVLFVFPFSF